MFGGGTGRNLTRFYSTFADSLIGAISPFVALDILHHVDEKDRGYFRASREKRVGMTLEVFVANRESKLTAFRASLAPLRNALKSQPFFGGLHPLYADYCHLWPVPMGAMHQSVRAAGARPIR